MFCRLTFQVFSLVVKLCLGYSETSDKVLTPGSQKVGSMLQNVHCTLVSFRFCLIILFSIFLSPFVVVFALCFL